MVSFAASVLRCAHKPATEFQGKHAVFFFSIFFALIPKFYKSGDVWAKENSCLLELFTRSPDHCSVGSFKPT